jgi:hypothetical protein
MNFVKGHTIISVSLAMAFLSLPRNSCFLSRWNSDELVSQGGGFPLELLDL